MKWRVKIIRPSLYFPQNIIDTDKKLQYIDNRNVHIEQEVKNLETLCSQEESTIDQLEKILGIIDSMTLSSEHKTLTLEETARTFKQLKVRTRIGP